MSWNLAPSGRGGDLGGRPGAGGGHRQPLFPTAHNWSRRPSHSACDEVHAMLCPLFCICLTQLFSYCVWVQMLTDGRTCYKFRYLCGITGCIEHHSGVMPYCCSLACRRHGSRRQTTMTTRGLVVCHHLALVNLKLALVNGSLCSTGQSDIRFMKVGCSATSVLNVFMYHASRTFQNKFGSNLC
jgi:hypothetical protein